MFEIQNFDISIFEVKNEKVNLTKICQSFNKDVKEWKRLPSTIAFLNAYQGVGKSPIITVTGKGKEQGTFGTREIALKLAQWISPEFEVFCIQKLDELFQNGKTELRQASQLTTLDILELATNEIKKLKAELDYKNQIVIERAESVPAEKMRITINRVVRNFAKRQNTIHQIVWGKLYEEFKYKFSIDLKARAKKGQSKIQIAEDLGKLEDLYNLALKMFEVKEILSLN